MKDKQRGKNGSGSLPFFLMGNGPEGLDRGLERVYTSNITIEQMLNHINIEKEIIP